MKRIDLPDAHFGRVGAPEPDWRSHDERDPDDEQLTETPQSVQMMLGFDPARRRKQRQAATEPQHTPTKATANPGGLFHWRAADGDSWCGIGRLLAMTSLSAATVSRLVAAGRFPPPLMRGRVRLWRVADVLCWIESPAAYRVVDLPPGD